jgi:hypothetical protein
MGTSNSKVAVQPKLTEEPKMDSKIINEISDPFSEIKIIMADSSGRDSLIKFLESEHQNDNLLLINVSYFYNIIY